MARSPRHAPSSPLVDPAFEAALAAHAAQRDALLASVRVFAERLTTRVVSHSDGSFSVMFGDPVGHGLMMSGPGLAELSVELRHSPKDSSALRFLPRTFALGPDADLDLVEAQGRALLEAVAFARVLWALAHA